MPITIRLENGRLLVLFSYSPEMVAKIKTVPGRIWHQADKCWSMPNAPDIRARLNTLFGGSPLQEPLPPTSKRPSSAMNALIDKVKAAIRIRLERTDVERQVGHYLLQAPIFLLKPFEPARALVSK